MTLLKARRRACLFAVLAILSASITPAFAQKKAPDGVKILLLSGGARQHHGYREQALLLSSALENTGQYEVTICEDGSILTSPGMSKYSVLIVHVDRRDPEKGRLSGRDCSEDTPSDSRSRRFPTQRRALLQTPDARQYHAFSRGAS